MVDEFIRKLGTDVEVAGIIAKETGREITRQTVSNWRRRGAVAHWARVTLSIAASARGIATPAGFLITAGPKRASRKGADDGR